MLNTLDASPEIRIFDDRENGTPRGIAENGKVFVASVSPQVRASVAATYGVSQRKAGYLIEQFLSGPRGLRAGGKHGSGFTWVVDTNVMRQAVLELTNAEVAEALGQPESGVSSSSADFPLPSRPILSSSCPGWICYAEKTHPHVLPHISRLKSPQALTGTLIKTVLSRRLNIPASQIWHLAIMPCFDKKLEASRQELTDMSWNSTSSPNTDEDAGSTRDTVRDVDCVITSRELLTLASARNVSFPSLPLKPVATTFNPPFPDPILSNFLFPSHRHSANQSPVSGPSGGYLHHLLSTHQSRSPGSTIHTQRGRNADVVEYTVSTQAGDPLIKAARYYGFRNIQNLVRKLKPARVSKLPGARQPGAASGMAGNSRRKPASAAGGNSNNITDYAYVEVMACPGGCTNGGGQIRVEDARQLGTAQNEEQQEQEQEPPQKPTPNEQRAWLARVDEAYYSEDSDDADDQDQMEEEAAEEQRNGSASAESGIGSAHDVNSILFHWSSLTQIPLEKLVYTTYRKVESDVGKNLEAGGAGDTTRVAELAGKIGGGW